MNEVAAGAVIVARGRCEGGSNLVAADDPLATLQRDCGGSIPGTIAIPALLALTRRAWQSRAKLAQVFHAQDGVNAIRALVEIAIDDDGLALAFSNWRVSALEPASPPEPGEEQAILAQAADLHARLDARQAVLAVGRASPTLEQLGAALSASFGRPWTDFVVIPGVNHQQPLHWRLIDGAEVALEGTGERWRARLIPVPGEGTVAGFDLFLLPAAIDAVPEGDQPAPRGAPLPEALDGVLGRDLAPALRQPINRIIANAETIRTRLAGPLIDEYANYAGDIAEAARHLLGLVEDLADLDAIEAQDFAPASDRIDLADAARRAAGILGMRASERGIVVHLPPEGEQVAAVGEWRRVLQILLNLLGNALRYSPEGSTVNVTVEHRGRRATVSVTDEGPGLAPAEQGKIFAKFERLGRSGDGGSGLGLYISRRLARAMNGGLTVESVPGDGARFTLELPAG